jgi:hypothetical protein
MSCKKERAKFMPSKRETVHNYSPEKLAECLQHGPSEGGYYYAALAQFELLKFEGQERVNTAQIEAASAATEAAEAAKRTAEYTKQNAVYMLLSVLAILLTSGASAFFQFLTWAQIRPS